MKGSSLKAVLIVTALLGASSALADGTPAGTAISNVATLTFQPPMPPTPPGTPPGPNTNPPTVIPSNPINVVVDKVYNLLITPDGTPAAPGQTVTGVPGQTAVLTYTVKNTSNTADTVNLSSAVQNFSDPVTLRKDDGDNVFDATKDTAATSLSLAAGESVRLYATITTPNNAAGTSNPINVIGTSQGDASKVDNNNWGNVTTGNAAGGTVDKSAYSYGTDASCLVPTGPGGTPVAAPTPLAPTGTPAPSGGTCAAPVLLADKTTTGPVKIIPNELIQYRVVATNTGNGPLSNAILRDLIPANMRGVSIGGSFSGTTKVLFSLNGTTWSAAAPSISGQEGVTVAIAVDSNGDNTITAEDSLPAQGVLTLLLNTQVK